MKIGFLNNLKTTILQDLQRPSKISFERVGFVYGTERDGLLVLDEYLPVLDEHYEESTSYGAVFGKEAIKEALKLLMTSGKSCFHIHEHSDYVGPNFSRADFKTSVDLCETFHNFNPGIAHGCLIICGNSINALIIKPDGKIEQKLIGGYYERL